MTASSLVGHHHPQRLEVELAAQHGGVRERRPARLREPREAAQEDLLDALGDADLARGQRRRPAARLEQVPHDLLDEERVAVGLVVDGAHQRRRRFVPGLRGDQRGRRCARRGPPATRRAAGGRAAGRRAARPARPAASPSRCVPTISSGASSWARSTWRRSWSVGPVGPVQVVEHEQDRRADAGVAQQQRDRLEHQVAPRLGVVRRRARERVDLELGDQLRELGGAGARPHGVDGVADVVAAAPRRTAGRTAAAPAGSSRRARCPPRAPRARARRSAASCRSPAGRSSSTKRRWPDRAAAHASRRRAELGRAADERAAPARGEDGGQRDAVARALARQQPPVQLDDLWRGRHAELVAQQASAGPRRRAAPRRRCRPRPAPPSAAGGRSRGSASARPARAPPARRRPAPRRRARRARPTRAPRARAPRPAGGAPAPTPRRGAGGTPARAARPPLARAREPRRPQTARRAFSSSRAAWSTSTQTGSGSARRSRSRPSIVAGASARRSRERIGRSAPWGSRGGLLGPDDRDQLAAVDRAVGVGEQEAQERRAPGPRADRRSRRVRRSRPPAGRTGGPWFGTRASA